ncbi:helix-turn-helix domain-containing protein [Kribbella deserti]|uniref:Helix-turn-helix domain-containing protein n=1 Tax=Kribbella deserti TaxID=1926257 RepID=A0ABV6QE57_9ACTN
MLDAEGTFAVRMRQRRTARGHSLATLAASINERIPGTKLYTASTLSRFESGKRRIHLDDAYRIATRLGVEIETMLSPVTCTACDDFPPAGFVCQTCGAQAVWP